MMLNLHNTCILLHIWELLFVLFPTLFLLACFVQVVELLLFIRSISVATCLFFFLSCSHKKKIILVFLMCQGCCLLKGL